LAIFSPIDLLGLQAFAFSAFAENPETAMNKMSDVELCAFREQNGAELKHRAYEVRFEQVAGGNMRVRAGSGWNTPLRWM
jgi:hypothetical protein